MNYRQTMNDKSGYLRSFVAFLAICWCCSVGAVAAERTDFGPEDPPIMLEVIDYTHDGDELQGFKAVPKAASKRNPVPAVVMVP